MYHPHYLDQVYRTCMVLKVAAEPFNRAHDDDSNQYGTLTVDGLEFTAKYWGGNQPFIQISDNNVTGNAVSHFRNLRLVNCRFDNVEKADVLQHVKDITLSNVSINGMILNETFTQ